MAPCTSSVAKASLTSTVLFLVLSGAVGNTFLARDPAAPNGDGRDLLRDLEGAAGEGKKAAIQARVGLMEEALRPTFQALPRSADNRLEAGAVRYLLHRLFVDRHGWFVRGLDAGGEAWDSSSPADVFKGHDGEVHGLFEEHLARGFGLHEVAVLAATLESFVHMETIDRLRTAYRLADVAESAVATEEQVSTVMDTYMLMYVLGTNHSTITKERMAASWDTIHEVYPHWDETRRWVREVRNEVIPSAKDAPTSFEATTRVVEEIAERYGRWQDRECKDIKASLVKMEHGSSGRVRLETFYASALNGSWQFSESKAYLRQLGALDENDQLRPAVMIPNYVNAPSNCVASSKFYSVCCINECEALLGHLERNIAAPDASPARIAELVAALPSATVPAPRQLSAPVLQRLEEIAQQHNGRVPFHGRLFAQWLHHAYPRECPYPQLSGTSTPKTPEQWAEHTGEEAVADEATMRWHIKEAQRHSAAAAPAVANVTRTHEEELPWSAEEELFVSRPAAPAPEPTKGRFGVTGGLMMFAAIFSTALTLVRSVNGAASALAATDSNHKYCV